MRTTYQLTEEQYQRIVSASRSVPYILGSNGIGPRSPQENANDAWRAIGDELGFVWDTAQPIGGSDRQFTAEPKVQQCGSCGCPTSAHVGLGGGCLADRGGCDNCEGRSSL